MAKKYYSTVGIDLGSTSTGFFEMSWNEGAKDISTSSAVIIADPVSKTWMQENRRIKRHQRRNIKRRKLAKRLLKTIIENEYSIEYSKEIMPNRTFGNLINGLLNRRGFTFATEEIDPDLIESLDISVRANLPPPLNDIFTPQSGSIEQSIRRLLSDEKLLKSLNSPLLSMHSKNDLKKSKELEHEIIRLSNLTGIEGKDIKGKLIDTLWHFSELVNSANSAHLKGQRHRTRYFDEIRFDFTNNKKLQQFLTNRKINPNELLNIICHISNLQIGPLRRYFNSKTFKEKDQLDWERLHWLLNRWLTSWHPNGNETIRILRHDCLSNLKQLGVKAFLKTYDPAKTIPPFEDMNNRRPPKCQSLILNKASLEAYPISKWIGLLLKPLEQTHPSAGASVREFNDDLRQLQTLIDLSSKLDAFNLRKIANAKNLDSKEGVFLKTNFGASANLFFDFIKKYFNEISEARTGVKTFNSKSVIRVCNSNPPHKKSVWQIHLSRILLSGIPKTKRPPMKDIELWLKDEKIGNKLIRKHLEECSVFVKTVGNGLKPKLAQIQWKIDHNKTLETDEQQLRKIEERASDFAHEFSEHFNVERRLTESFSSIWSQAQIFEIVFKDQSGFSRTCKACSEDNSRRSEVFDLADDNRSGLAVSLSAEPIRPFDGFVARIIDDIANETAKLIIGTQQTHIKDGDELILSIAIEENRFESQDGIVSLKKKQAASTRKSFNGTDPELYWLTKEERIINDGSKICPYSGKNISKNVQIDHIIPRWWSKQYMDAVFDSEINLVACTVEGNRDKGAELYSVKELHDNWCKKNFGTTDKRQLAKIADAFFEKQFRGSAINDVSRLTSEERNLVRLCLFLDDEKRKEIIKSLGSRKAGVVNGTQAYFIKRLLGRLRIAFQKQPNLRLSISSSKISAELVSQTRRGFAATNKSFEKHTPQPIASHAIDAAITCYLEIEQASTQKRPPGFESEEPAQIIGSLLNPGINIIEIARSPANKRRKLWGYSLFKDSHFGEKFVPILVQKDNSVLLGFSETNSLRVLGDTKAFLDMIRPWCRHKISKTGFSSFSVDKQRVFQDLHSGKLDEIIWAIIRTLQYFQRRQDIISTFVSQNKKAEIEKVFNANNFAVKIQAIPKSYPFRFETGSVSIPAKHIWEDLVKTKEFKSWFNKEKPNTSDQAFLHFLRDVFLPNVSKEKQRHSRVRQNFSLPMIDNPSGGFRHQRKTNEGHLVFQVKSSNFKGIGLKIDNNSIKNEIVYHPVFSNTSLVPTDVSKPIGNEYHQSVELGDWRQVKIEKFPGSIFMAIGEATPRMLVRITGEIASLKRIGIPIDKNLLTISREISGIKLNDAFSKTLGKPRGGKVWVVSIGENCTIEYITESTSNDMKDLYLKGEVCSI
jgi:hypothetical protein